MCKKVLLYACFLLVFTGYSCKPAQKADDNTSSCTQGSKCQLISECESEIDLLDTIFPCKSDGETIWICCSDKNAAVSKTPISNTGLSTSTTVTTTTKGPLKTKTTITTSKPTPTAATTPKPTPVKKFWAKIPKELQDKVNLLPGDCGQLDLLDKVINGKNSQLGQFPWMVLLGHEQNNVKQFWCGGTIISKRYILTAAHCGSVGSYTLKIARIGEWNVSSEIDCNGYNECAPAPIDAEIEEIIIHEKFGDKNLPSFQNDIALLRLSKDLEFNEYVRPICLHPEIQKNTSIMYTISGWGVSEEGSNILNPVLQFAKVNLYHFGECNTIAPPEVKPLSRSQFCAGGSIENTCKGDSGGPLSFKISGIDRIFQKGIVSLSTTTECGVEEKPNIYTEVSYYINWILKNIK